MNRVSEDNPRLAPSVYALYRFAAKLRAHKPLADTCLDRMTASLRGLERVALHADLCILATLASALARARAVPFAA